MSLEKEIQLLKEENARLKEKLVQYVVTMNELREELAKSKVGRKISITEDIQQDIVKLRKEGNTVRKIASIVGVSTGSVMNVCKKYGVEK